MGPGAGAYGGHIVTQGKPNELDPESMTARFLRDQEQVTVAEAPRKGNSKKISITNARGHNLRSVDLEFPLGTFVAVTGVSGSGKSSLINQTLVPILSNHFYKSKAVPELRLELEPIPWHRSSMLVLYLQALQYPLFA